MGFRPAQFEKVVSQIIAEPGASLFLGRDGHVRFGERECGYREQNTALRSKIDELSAAVAFLLLERLLKHEVGFNIDRHCIGFVSMRACRNEPVSSDKPAEGEPCSKLRSPDRVMSLNHVKTTSSNASGPMLKGSCCNFWK